LEPKQTIGDLKLKKSPGFISGIMIGTICLIAGMVLRVSAPDFSGFFARGHSESVLPIWMLLIGFAILNYIFAGLSQAMHGRTFKDERLAVGRVDEQDSGANR
jgi:hypothetical protein